jgi:hypothetical protein
MVGYPEEGKGSSKVIPANHFEPFARLIPSPRRPPLVIAKMRTGRLRPNEQNLFSLSGILKFPQIYMNAA